MGTAGTARLRLGAVAVCVLLVVSGCGGIGGPQAPERTPFDVPSATDGPTPTTDPDTSDRYPPGVNASGVVDTYALLSSHREALENRSVTAQSNLVQRYADNGTVRYFSRTVGKFDGSDAYVFRQVGGTAVTLFPDGEGRIEVWSNGSAGVRAVFGTEENDTAYRPFRVPSEFNYDRFDGLFGLFSILDPALEGRRTEGDTEVFVLRKERANLSESGERLLTRFGIENPRNITFVAQVTAEGRVLGYDLSYDATAGNATVRVTQGFRFEDVGSTTVPRPSWVDDAVEEVCSGADSPDWCG